MRHFLAQQRIIIRPIVLLRGGGRQVLTQKPKAEKSPLPQHVPRLGQNPFVVFPFRVMHSIAPSFSPRRQKRHAPDVLDQLRPAVRGARLGPPELVPEQSHPTARVPRLDAYLELGPEVGRHRPFGIGREKFLRGAVLQDERLPGKDGRARIAEPCESRVLGLGRDVGGPVRVVGGAVPGQVEKLTAGQGRASGGQVEGRTLLLDEAAIVVRGGGIAHFLAASSASVRFVGARHEGGAALDPERFAPPHHVVVRGPLPTAITSSAFGPPSSSLVGSDRTEQEGIARHGRRKSIAATAIAVATAVGGHPAGRRRADGRDELAAVVSSGGFVRVARERPPRLQVKERQRPAVVDYPIRTSNLLDRRGTPPDLLLEPSVPTLLLIPFLLLLLVKAELLLPVPYFRPIPVPLPTRQLLGGEGVHQVRRAEWHCCARSTHSSSERLGSLLRHPPQCQYYPSSLASSTSPGENGKKSKTAKTIFPNIN
mmetsp:Transcript_3661/g.6421  ORF Transcript_3661/g.6421 Transcript_3661/m.6421 type:complete len:482 (+) Transcript_3661:163-1608(+)